jgi:hypothetical protein
MIGALLTRARAFFAVPPPPKNVRSVEDILTEAQPPALGPGPKCVQYDVSMEGYTRRRDLDPRDYAFHAHYHTVDGMRRAYEGARCPHLRPIFDEVAR